MSLRDYFAAAAVHEVLQEVGLTVSAVNEERRESNIRAAAEVAYEIADAMLAARRIPKCCREDGKNCADHNAPGVGR